MVHYHLIYTPKGLTDLHPDSLPYDRFIACYEIGKGGPHYHIYIETDYAEDKIRDTLKEVQKIPTGQRGKKSLHYSCRTVAEHPPDYPTQDLRKFTLGYVQKNEDRKLMKGYSEIELKEALDYYHEQHEQQRELQKPPEPTIYADKEDESVQGQWAEYVVFFEKLFKDPLNKANISMAYLRKKSDAFWAPRNNGLFPQASKFRRFLKSISYIYRKDLRTATSTYDDDIKNLGY